MRSVWGRAPFLILLAPLACQNMIGLSDPAVQEGTSPSGEAGPPAETPAGTGQGSSSGDGIQAGFVSGSLVLACSDTNLEDPGSHFIRRLTTAEYVSSVEAGLGVDIRKQAGASLPKDLRADGFGNTASTLVPTLEHIEAYASLAETIVEKLGPLTPWAKQYVSCSDTSKACLQSLVEAVGAYIFRGPVSMAEMDALLSIRVTLEGENADFEESVGLILEAMLQSPRFVYRMEESPQSSSVEVLGAFELANRLSYFIWGAPPDDELYLAASRSELSTDQQLLSQVRRMLLDPRARVNFSYFVRDWLELDRMDNLARDRDLFPNWDAQLAADMKEETLSFFEHLVWEEERPLRELFNSKLTFATRRLAEHYGFEDPRDGLQQYDLSNVPERAGFLTQGSLLAVGGDQSSMVARGLFLLEHVLCTELGSPPPNVDTTPRPASSGASERDFSEERVDNPSCGGCHAQMEPLAWGIGKFDATGAYVDKDAHGNSLKEDGYVLLPGETEKRAYGTSEEMMQILSGSDRVVECMGLKVLQFSAGRALGEMDGCSFELMRDRFLASEGTYRDLVESIVLTPMFRKIRAE